MIFVGSKVKICKGCAERDISKGQIWTITNIVSLGADYSHSVSVTMQHSSRTVVWYARHRNRLADAIVNLNDGNPMHKIKISLV